MTRRPLRGYGPVLAGAVVFGLVAALVPTVGHELRVSSSAGPAGSSSGALEDPAGTGPSLHTGGPAAPGGPHRPGSGRTEGRATAVAGTGSGPSASARTATGPAGGDQPVAAAGAGARPCPDRDVQVPGDPYSPPCLVFSGDNGAATSRGVTADKIIISARLGGLPDLSITPADGGPSQHFSFNEREMRQAISGLVDYFNSRFQFYGRKLEVVFHDTRGSLIDEVQGGGQEGAEADAVRVAEEIKAFAEVVGLTGPYVDALARRKVVNFGALYMPQDWLSARRPYVWSQATDCTFIMRHLADYLHKRVVNRPATHAGDNLKGRERVLGAIGPDVPYYQKCMEALEEAAQAAGYTFATRVNYKLDFNSLSNQAASVVAKLRSAGITTVVCGCDPAFPVFLTARAQEQSYQPEWVVPGVAFMDFDAAGQMYQQDQWAGAFGISFLGTQQPLRASYGYAAFKAARPDEEPSPLVDLLYYQLYLLAVGVHMAGPDLTPETFEAGMYAYPGGSGPMGTWRFTPGRYTPTQDAREIYWDPQRTSPQNQERGSYVTTEADRRYRPGEWPEGNPPGPGRAREP